MSEGKTTLHSTWCGIVDKFPWIFTNSVWNWVINYLPLFVFSLVLCFINACVSLLCLSLCIYTYIYYIWDLVFCHLDRRQKYQVLLALDPARIEGKLEECREATKGHGWGERHSCWERGAVTGYWFYPIKVKDSGRGPIAGLQQSEGIILWNRHWNVESRGR